MQSKFGRWSVLTALTSALGLLGAFASSASADSLSCKIEGTIKLSPGLTETPQVQNIAITKHKGALLSNCSATETKVTGGNINIHMKTEKAVTCAVLKGTGEAVVETNAIFKWQPKGEGFENSTGTFTMPLTEAPVNLGGTVAAGTFPFSEDTISGTVTQTYSGGDTCGVSVGHKKAKKVKKGTFTGLITIS
jgi:hypothetical protein